MTYPVPPDALRESVAFIGRTGAGKTFAAKGAVELLLDEASARVCILDPTGVWYGLRSNAKGTGPGFPVVVFGGDHADVPIADTSGQALAELVATKNLPAIIDLSNLTIGGRIRFATGFLEELYRKNRTPLTLVVDEADTFAPQRVQPDESVMLSRMEQICRRGRVRGFRPWLITQRPASLNKNVLSQANTLIAMQLTAPQDRAAVGDWIEGQADKVEGKRVLAELPRLKKGEAWVWSPSHDVLERVKFPPIRTFDSGRTPEDGEAAPMLKLAEVDLAGIAESFKVIDEQAAANDPKRLRARILELERAMAKAQPVPPSEQLLHQEYARGKVAGYKEGVAAVLEIVKEVDREVHNLEASMGKLRSAAAKYADVAGVKPRGADLALPSAAEVKGILRDEWTPPARLVDESRKVHQNKVDDSANLHRPARGNGHASGSRELVRNPQPPPPGPPPGSLSKSERKVLSALAQYPNGRTKNQVALLSGYAVRGGSFANTLSSLRVKGLLAGDAAKLTITERGIGELGPFDPLPSGRELLEHWLGQLSKAERKMLEALAEAYPHTLSKAQLANRTGYEARGGSFANALSRLRVLELIHGRGELRASDDLF